MPKVGEFQDRRREKCCDGEMQSRMRALEIYRETHSEKLDRLTKTLDANNTNLQELTLKLTDLRVTQRNTHAFAGALGSILGFFGQELFKVFK